MARRRDITGLIGKPLENSGLTILRYAKEPDAGRHVMVRALCVCGRETETRLSYVLNRHTTSCGCRKHELYVNHTRAAAKKLGVATRRNCFVYCCAGQPLAAAARFGVSKAVIDCAYHEQAARLQALPTAMMQDLRLRVLGGDSYEAIARDHQMHPAEVAWLAKHEIRPAEAARIERAETDALLQGFALAHIWMAKLKLERQRRNRFRASEFANPSSKKFAKCELGFAWFWIVARAPSGPLSAPDKELVRWFRRTAAYTLQIRREERRRYAMVRRPITFTPTQTSNELLAA